MELQQLRYFDEVARTQHVTNSAKKLNVAQPALTQSIRRLERELGVTLFERVGRNVRLTACGEALQKRIAPLLAALDELPEELAVVAGREQAAVHLAIESASALAVDAIAAYRASHPDARFVVAQETAARRWDLRIRTVRADGAATGARRFTERIGIAVPAERAAGGPLALTDLEGEPFICLAGQPHVPRGMRRGMCAGGVRAARGVRERQPRRGEEHERAGAGRGVLARAQLGQPRGQQRHADGHRRRPVRAHHRDRAGTRPPQQRSRGVPRLPRLSVRSALARALAPTRLGCAPPPASCG